jgi:hypothetical protein
VRNTLVANHLRGNCAGTITSQGHNLDDDNTCGFFATGDLSNLLDALVGPLDEHGGSTRTHALLMGSLAIDGGDPVTCLPTDQRGFGRAGTCDIGSYEFNGTAP